jgi:Leucine-rich repeat (LRR) protein
MDNGIHELESNCIVDLPLISRIDINANKISHIPHDALLNLSSSRSPLTFHLDLRKNHMTELPEKFLDLPHLTHLDLSKGKLQTIHPLAFSRTPHLKVIYLQSNELTHIGNGTFNLSLISDLNLDGNKLESLTGGPFRQGMMLLSLSVVANNLRQIDRSLFTTVKILVLDISLNHITSLPDTLTYPHQAHMTKLTAISNQITFIPAGALTGMKWLSAINLMENSITRIEPNSFQRLEILKELNLIGNPLQTVPSNVFQDMKGTDMYVNAFANYNKLSA